MDGIHPSVGWPGRFAFWKAAPSAALCSHSHFITVGLQVAKQTSHSLVNCAKNLISDHWLETQKEAIKQAPQFQRQPNPRQKVIQLMVFPALFPHVGSTF